MQTLTRFQWMLPALLSMAVLVPVPALAQSYQLTPSTMTFTPSGSRATRAFQIISTGDQPIAIEIHMAERQMDIDGGETHPDAEDDFLIYPPQILLHPGEVQTVRVTWLGDPNPDQELAYRIITEQLPIPIAQPEAEASRGPSVAISALFRYIGSVYIRPSNVAANIVLHHAAHETIDGEDALVLVFENQGTAHQLLSNLRLTLTPVDAAGRPQAALSLSPEQVEPASGHNILPGRQRRFVLPWPADVPIGPVTAAFEFDRDL